MLKVAINSLYYNNLDPRIVESSRSVMRKFDIAVNYVETDMVHGEFLDMVCNTLDADVYVFFDADCVPLNREIFDDCFNYVVRNDSFVGLAQVSNHIAPAHHIFACASFYMITKNCYKYLGTSFAPNYRSDGSEEMSYSAETKMKKYRALYPTKYDRIPYGEAYPWRLGNYGWYGVGTLYENSIYHLFQSRFNNNVDLYVKRCAQIVAGEFDTSSMFDCKTDPLRS